jgi:hypothetical protein
VDRKPATRRRESSGELDDDREELVRAIQSAVNFSVDASPVGFWKQVEPYFAYMIPAEIDHLHQLVGFLFLIFFDFNLCIGIQCLLLSETFGLVPSFYPLFETQLLMTVL